MNKKMNYLAIMPFTGAAILLLWLFIKGLKNEINRDKFLGISFISGIVFFISTAGLMIAASVIGVYVDNIIVAYIGYPFAIIIGGYLMNLYTFKSINKKWKDLEKAD